MRAWTALGLTIAGFLAPVAAARDVDRDLGDVAFGPGGAVLEGSETYEGFGSVPTYTRLVVRDEEARTAALARLYADPAEAFGAQLRGFVARYLGQFPLLLGLRPGPALPLEAPPRGPVRRLGLALGLGLLLPVALVAGAGVEAWRVATRRRRLAAAAG